MDVLLRNFWRSCFWRNNWQLLLKNQIAFFLEQQWMPLIGWRGNRRDWVIVAKWCWCWISKHKKVTASYFVKRYWGLSNLFICSKMIVHLILHFMILFKLSYFCLEKLEHERFIKVFNSLNIFEQLLRKKTMQNFKMCTCYTNSVIVAHPDAEIWVFMQNNVIRWQLNHQHLGSSVPWAYLTGH